MDINPNASDPLLDAAAGEALGANSPADSAAYQRELTLAGSEARTSDRHLRETVARLAAASPYMAPPPDLRGRILQATATASFRMEDYRKAVRDNSWVYKWGFYAAALFLMAAAWFNLSTRGQLTAANVALSQQARDRDQAVAALSHERDQVLAAVVNPNGLPVTLMDENGAPFARAIADLKTHTALLIVPQKLLDQGKTVQLVLPQNGANIPFQTVVFGAPSDTLNLTVPRTSVATLMNSIKTLTPDPDQSHAPRIASQH